MSGRGILLGCVLTGIVSVSLWVASKHVDHTSNGSHGAMVHADTSLQEGGQSTFAALIEIVAMLEQDAATDWRQVDIDALRIHLVDMHHLMLDTSSVKSLPAENQIQFEVQGSPVSIPSIHRMVPAHSRFISQSRGWIIEPELLDDGASLTITVEDAATLNRINALGFYGFMALDSHHQAHHYQMALGMSH